MGTPLAWYNLLHNKIRTLTAMAGVAFAVVLIFMQLGFLGALEHTATVVYSAVDFDILLRSPDYLHISDTRTFSKNRLATAAATEGVESALPFYVQPTLWQSPNDGTKRGILVLGVRPTDDVFTLPEISSQTERLVAAEFLLIDRASRKEFGPIDKQMFGDHDVGRDASLTDSPVRIVGHFHLGGGLANDGTVLMSDRGFAKVMPGRSTDDVSLGLIKLAPGTDVRAAAERLKRELPGDVEVLTRQEAIDFELNRWVNETSLGLIFRLGVGLSMFVGAAIVYQVLSTDVANHLAEYATLKAMGYTDRYLAGVVMMQAVTLAVVGFVPSLVAAVLLYAFTSVAANIPIEMNLTRIVVVLLLAVAMCSVSGLAALRKIRTADPADLF